MIATFNMLLLLAPPSPRERGGVRRFDVFPEDDGSASQTVGHTAAADHLRAVCLPRQTS